MKTVAQTKVVRMKPAWAGEVGAMVRRVIWNLAYYNLRARREEVKKFTPQELKKLSAADQDAVLVAVLAGRPVGFCISRYDDGVIWLSWFGVRADSRGLGVGWALLEALQGTVRRRRCHKIWCDTRTSNRASQRLLKKFGFRRICKLEKHWYGQDFYLWEKAVR